ncbi:carbohydrate ABC transporter permease [Brachybacterium endophyticum]|uniref:Carbohydrate ABC transporter permease n=1 Tax=Brachybacterium endophyticum TaxID=2182385 RepID=A0A2U2RJ11_9MICO|nr:carbohydrate ABC transporter permease [Brachybacterium endophyticum]PWH05846.1 carbohydrate ABC transporter permease [Brachybacterium endophyticum]
MSTPRTAPPQGRAGSAPAPGRRRRRRPGALVLSSLAVLAALAFLFPLLWTLYTSISTPADVYTLPPRIKPVGQWDEYVAAAGENYARAWAAAPWPRYFGNTVLIAVCVVGLTLLTGLLAAFAFSRMRFRGRGALFLLVMSVMMVPQTVLLVPNFLLAQKMHLYDTYAIQILPWGASVFGIFLLRQFFQTLPTEIFEAAELDGAGAVRMLVQVAGPLAVPTMVLVALNAFMGSWNSFVWPYFMTKSDQLRPIEVGLQTFQSENGNDWTAMSAAVVFTTIPVILLFLFLQKYFVHGTVTTDGAVRG